MARRISYASKKTPAVVVTAYRAWVYGNLVLPSTAYRYDIPTLRSYFLFVWAQVGFLCRFPEPNQPALRIKTLKSTPKFTGLSDF